MEPVDTKLLKVPSYYAVIENPMDMGTIIKRVTHNYYHNVNELVYDVRLVISNCFKFNMPGSLVYRNGQELEELFMEVYDRMPQGAEVPLSKEVAEKSLMKHQCRCRLRKVREETDELEQDAQELFAEKWLPMVEALNNENLKTLEDFDARLHNILKYCKEHNKRIQGTYDYESSQIREEKGYKGAHNAYDELYDSLRECRMPPFDWEDGLIDTLNDTIKSLQKNLTNSRRRVKQKEKLGYCERLLPILINAQIISEGLCSQTYMPDSSEEDEPTSDPNTIDPIERELIRKQFSELDTEAKYDIMHIIEQSELSDERAYFLPKFSQKTMLLVKKAIKGYQMHLNTEVLALYDSESQANASFSLSNYAYL
ncbi:uncharacterized protein LOC115564677 [Drosophila navojoa]|uniref:uncharacterized protein LOC115564677 n=1 Tax=Drosophila navojoa TaxID=7232 RepID=UPI0011BDDCE4|nr:uncharacterized protein LOC115564677 [Drosophila navojoa]